jgi:hypothetical protein
VSDEGKRAMSADAVRFLKATFMRESTMSIGERAALFDSMSEEDREVVRGALSQVMVKHTQELETKIVLFNKDKEA